MARERRNYTDEFKKKIVECRGKIIFEMSRWIDYAATFRYNLYTNRKQAD